jgi:hypothetical protein
MRGHDRALASRDSGARAYRSRIGAWCETLRVCARLRLADLLGGLPIAGDLKFGLPPEEAMRSCLIATALARQQGLAEEAVADTFYTALLMHVGCSALSHETAAVFGDERAVLSVVADRNVADPVTSPRRCCRRPLRRGVRAVAGGTRLRRECDRAAHRTRPSQHDRPRVRRGPTVESLRDVRMPTAHLRSPLRQHALQPIDLSGASFTAARTCPAAAPRREQFRCDCRAGPA